jgi:hypothetical protein
MFAYLTSLCLHVDMFRTDVYEDTGYSDLYAGSANDLFSNGLYEIWWNESVPFHIARASVRSTRGLGPTMTARGQSVGISIGMLPQTLIMSITVQKTSKYYTTEFDLEEGF